MIFQLREKELGTVCDVEVYCDSELDCIEINSSVFVEGYSKLLAKNLGRVNEIIQDFTEIEDLRGWLWEKYFMKNKNIYSDNHMKNVREHISNLLKNVGSKYQLYLYED